MNSVSRPRARVIVGRGGRTLVRVGALALLGAGCAAETLLDVPKKRGLGIEDRRPVQFAQYVDLGSLEGATFMVALGVNARSEAVGTAFGQRIGQRAFYSNGGLVDLGPGLARDISETGLVVGGIGGTGGSVPAVWRREASGWVAERLPTDPALGPACGLASGISGRGDRIVGSLCPRNPDGGLPALWTWADGRWRLLILPADDHPHAYAVDVNDAGVIIGHLGTNPGWRAVVWVPGGSGWTLEPLEPFPGGPQSRFAGEPVSRPSALNDRGDIVGVSNDAWGVERAVLWRRAAHGWDPPELIGDPAWESAFASGISDQGWVVGSAVPDRHSDQVGFVWISRTGRLVTLGSRGASSAQAVGPYGRIVGSGFDYSRAVTWIEAP